MSYDYLKIGKKIAYILRHNPNDIEMDNEGWVDTQSLLNEIKISLSTLKFIVDNDNKMRYSFNNNFSKIRANQGHSLSFVNIKFNEVKPPNFLYHGTSPDFIKNIIKTGLEKRCRLYVHLSQDKETAYKVGKRHSKTLEPIILVIDSKMMYNDGFKFLLSDNNVWLIDNVPSKYLKILNLESL